MERIIRDYLKNNYSLTDKRIEQEYRNIHNHPEIEAAFYAYILNGFCKEAMIEINGFTAENLVNNYPLSVLGAYNYLISLKEQPKEAMEYLRKGLPRK